MKAKLVIMIFLLIPISLSAQTYGWTNLRNNIPWDVSYAGLMDIFVIDQEIWIACAEESKLYYSNDGGSSTFSEYDTPAEFICIHMLNPDTGYAGSSGGGIYRTVDGGFTWTVLSPLVGSWVNDIDFPPSGEPGYCCGENGSIYQIDSTGITELESGTALNLNSITFPESAEEGWACGDTMVFHYADDSWTRVQSIPDGIFKTIYFADNQNGWAAGCNDSGEGQIFHTSDGVSWTEQVDPNPPGGVISSVSFLDDCLNGWAVGNIGKILHTIDGGENWNIEAPGMVNILLWSVRIVDAQTAYTVGNYNMFLKYGALNGIEGKSNSLPGSYSISQNYPNPFNATTMITFDIPENQFVTIKLYDLLGREVQTLYKENTQPGVHDIRVDSSELSSGFYFYRLQAGDHTQSKKMILIK
ncbi:MAG: T9SS type A sorting domain-containing protein [candidate division Zixibacteria bacterium]|nr:T9SS type A sorting domain-containing protein [candidate division Zixibacteria bacterium]